MTPEARLAMLAALQQCEEYFDDRADADCGQDGFVPNKEMALLTEIRAALDLAGNTKVTA